MGTLEVQHDRALMTAEKRRVAMTSVFAAVLLTTMKLVVGLWTGSLGILSEALHSALDLLAALITFFAVRVADKPPDADHQFGHGKIENLSALVETLLLLATCGWILYEAYQRLAGGGLHVDLNVWAFVVIIISILVDIGRSRALMRVAKKYNSQALEADALHFSTDIYSSLVVLVGLISVYFGFPEADAIAAAIVAGIVVWISVRLAKRTIDGLMDRAPEGLRAKIENAILDVDGVESIRALRIRGAGAEVFINLVIGVQRTTFFDQVHGIVDRVEESVRGAVPRSDVIVHAEPVVGVREKLSDKIEWLVRQSGLSAHNITILWVNESYVVEFDIEYPQGTSFTDAHELASEVEQRIRENVVSIAEVHIHLEEDTVSVLSARECSASEEALLARARQYVESHGEILSLESMNCLAKEDGLRLTTTFTLPRSHSLREMHAIVDAIESGLKSLDPRIVKVFIHAEPAD
ncbi:MAG: cation diffusion facilitator family transporter [Bacteroidetes bacterium]|nr:cation diffusion facilitator family transporter [Bacteroidota bacterium]